LKTLINKYLHKLKIKLYVCFVDFKKAFDSIDRNALFQKIENKGIGGNFLKLIKDMYSNTLYSCKFGDSYSEPFLTTLGVKQGDSLSPHCSTYLWMTLGQVLLTTHKLKSSKFRRSYI
jgi:hypothetical protein